MTNNHHIQCCLISIAEAVREKYGNSALSSIFNERSSSEAMHSAHHLYIMSTHAVIWSSTLRASSYKAHVTLKLVCIAWFMSRYISQHSEQRWATDGTWVRQTFWDFTSASIKQHCNWQLGYSFCAATLENVRRSQEVKSLWSRPAYFAWTRFSY